VQVENTLLQVEAVNQARMKTELDLAARIQLQLLPRRTPKWRHLQISARSRPALQVGGDFYEFIAEPGRHLLLAVGDVAGKGISAALLMSMTHTVIRSAAKFMPEATPERVVRRLNENLYDDFTDVSLFATVFVAQYDATRNLLVYANAGHSPVIYRPAGGSARLLEADSPPIGVLPESVTREAQVPMGPGDLLVAATDGFNDAINLSGERFGYDQLLALVDRESRESADRLVSILFDAVDRHAAGCPQADDLTVVIVKGE
jgi:sigma-B regulation protein RsbU (phosphoserine phosphatase)